MGSDCEAILPPEMIFEILSRTSFETLKICKEISESWKKMIYEPTFLPLSCKRTNSIFGYFLQTINNNDHQYTSVLVADAAAAVNVSLPSPAGMQILASSDEGILCCRRRIRKSYRYYACKPTTKQCQRLPSPIFPSETDAVAVVVVEAHPLRYIIVRLSQNGMQHNCEIFDSKVWEWEKIGCAPYGEMVHPCHAGVTIGHSVHWLTTNDSVLTWDARKGCLQCFPLPKTVRCDEAYTSKQLMEYEGGLGLRCSVGDRMEVWGLAERQREWTRKVGVDMTVVGENLWDNPEAIEFCNTGVAFMKDDKAVFYNLQSHSFNGVKRLPYRLRYPKWIFRFRSDFERVQLRPRGGR